MRALPLIAASSVRSGAPSEPAAQAIVYVHGPIGSTRACLESVLRDWPGKDVIIVDDGADDSVAAYLAQLAVSQGCTVIAERLGRAGSLARGVAASSAQVLVLVDSDVVLTRGAILALAEAADDDRAADILVPLLDCQLLDAARSEPEAYGEVLSFLETANLELVAAAIEGGGVPNSDAATPHAVGEQPCFALRRAAWPKLAAATSLRLRVAPSCYVSYPPPKDRLRLEDSGRPAAIGALERLRVVLSESPRVTNLVGRTVLFLLPTPGGGGGAHSVVQEAMGLRDCGLDARIVNSAAHRESFERHYPDAQGLCVFYRDEAELPALAAGPDFVVATNQASVSLLKLVSDERPDTIPMYYVQDYEPWFYPEYDLRRRAEAEGSYTLVPAARAFAKTEWLRRTVHRLHGIDVAAVRPSLDRTLYNGLAAKRRRPPGSVVVAAMIRPSSPRRNPVGTLKALRRTAQQHGSAVDTHIFGCSDEALRDLGEARGARCTNHGELTRGEVADLLRETDVFVDLSIYQAFGRTGLEAMAVGCATILPREGGVHEYADDNHNCLLVDTTNGGEAQQAIDRLISDRSLMLRLQEEGIRTGRGFSVRRTVWSELLVFGESLP